MPSFLAGGASFCGGLPAPLPATAVVRSGDGPTEWMGVRQISASERSALRDLPVDGLSSGES